MSEQESIHVLMSRVMADVGVIGKNQRNEHFNYNFRGIDDVLNALNPALTKHGVFYVPKIILQRLELAPNGKAWHAVIQVAYEFFGPKGDSVVAEGAGEALDSQDKALTKAQQMALKYALLATFCIPTEDQSRDDPDSQPAHDWQTPQPVAGDVSPQIQAQPSRAGATPPQTSGGRAVVGAPAPPTSTDDKAQFLGLIEARINSGDIAWDQVRGKAKVATARLGESPPATQAGLKNLSTEALRVLVGNL